MVDGEGGAARRIGFSRFRDGSAVGDVIPFYDAGTFHLYILTPPDGSLYFPERQHTPWRHVHTRDLVDWQESVVALEPGIEGDPDDGGIWTGSVVRDGLGYLAFYTAHGASDSDEHSQAICRAISVDGEVWIKDRDFVALEPDHSRFGAFDWRDPFVFWNRLEECWWMLVTARLIGVPPPQQGVIVVLTSNNLAQWSEPEVLYAPYATYAPECAEIFELDGHWVLAFSRFNGQRGTEYRISQSPRGPWRQTRPSALDGQHWYAAKSVTDDAGRRIAFGWIPDHDHKADKNSNNPWLWGGDLGLPRELHVDKSRRMTMSLPIEFRNRFSVAARTTETRRSGTWSSSGEVLRATAVGSVSTLTLSLDHPVSVGIVRVRFDGVTDVSQLGLVLGSTNGARAGIFLKPDTATISIVDLSELSDAPAPGWEDMLDHFGSRAEGVIPLPIDRTVEFACVHRGDILEVFAGGLCITARLRCESYDQLEFVIIDGDGVLPTAEWRTDVA